ncbi:MAG: nucleotidyltransferase [Clostridia bacterium]|nr:nucleotidyltransferase [Clostridia bacterium]
MNLVIMAAGMGSRFGGLKQIEPIDKNKNFIIDYSIFDAIRCGFDKVVFIIKRENFDTFKNTVGNRIENFIETEYVFQENTNVPAQYQIPESRQKPLGTTHAVLCAVPAIDDDFVVINADDFYGYDAFKTAADFLRADKTPRKHAVIGYKAANTIGDNGTVKRGICSVDENGKLLGICESLIDKDDSGILLAAPLDFPDIPPHEIANDTPVSMNMFSFKKDFTSELQTSFDGFLEAEKDNLGKAEKLLPSTLTESILAGRAEVEMIPTTATWYGITYKEDKQKVVDALQALVEKGEYPANLWASLKTKD